MQNLTSVSAADLTRRIDNEDLTASDLTDACLQRIDQRDGEVQAWTFLDRDHARAQATNLDDQGEPGNAPGALHGIPVGLKDIIDTADQPTENGTVLDAGRQPDVDAALVRRLRQAGAVIMGKTVTTELAFFAPGKTHNPHNPAHTPGGSSSGSAAAVAAGMVPLAVGTQTTGSVIRPAAFCGVVGYKPSRGLIARTGVVVQSDWLDTIGVFSKTVEDAGLIAEVLAGADPGDRHSRTLARPRLQAAANAKPPHPPRFAFVRSPVWDQADGEVQAGFEALADDLGWQCEAIDLPPSFDTGHAVHTNVMVAGMAHHLGHYYERGREQLSDRMCQAIEDGRKVLATDYLAGIDHIRRMNADLALVFSRYDAILTPATTGTAPLGLETTGDPAFCALWSLAGTPAISLPLLFGANGLPIGVQLIGPIGGDAGLLRTAAWLAAQKGMDVIPV